MKAGVSPVNHDILPSSKTKTSQVKQGNDLSVVSSMPGVSKQ